MSNSNKRNVIVSAIMIIVTCLSLMAGGTYAWFTDTASTAVNKIQSGNLDVKLEYSTDCSAWANVTEDTKVFQESTSWEPGRTETVYLRVTNAGSLAMKYSVGIYNLYDSTGKNVAGDKYRLSDFVKLGAAETTAAYADRQTAIDAVSGTADTLYHIGDKGIIGASLKANESKTYAMVLYMPTEVGNEANPKNNDTYWAAKVSFGISVYATQATAESDSFDDIYDNDVPTVMASKSASHGTYEITENMQANGRFGAIQAEKTAQFTINADVYAVYYYDGVGSAMAVCADGNSKVIINGGDFRQVSVPASDPVCDLIYALGDARIEINGGTFKAVTPANTLNCKDGSKAKIIVKGGRFYKYDPSNHTMGANEVVVPTGYEVTQDGDWYVVQKSAETPDTQL